VGEPVIDIVVTREGESWTVTSPQLPGFVGGRDSEDELRRDLWGMLRFAGVEDGTGLRHHEEVVHTTPEGDFVIRVANDEYRQQRLEVAGRVERALTIAVQREDMLNSPLTSTGDVLFICAVPSDTIAWCAGQLEADGHGAVVVLGVADQLIWAMHLYVGEARALTAHPPEDYGWSLDTSLGEVMRRVPFANHPPQLQLSA